VTCPLPVIGHVRTARTSREHTPVQAALNRAEHGTLEIEEPYAEGVAGLEGFDYAWLLSWLHDHRDPREPVPMAQVPFLLRRTPREVGVFATRGPRRVNPVGLSLVRLAGIEGRTIRFAGVDLVDGTPVIDLKPYVPAFDRAPGEPRAGWLDEVPLPNGVTPSDLLG
jgi:tRNA-Thr(GGU) m(6)t(6)A37 methyltransferase TsaA